MTGGFEFHSAGRIIFGSGRIKDLPGLALEFGHAALLVSSKTNPAADAVIAALELTGITVTCWIISSEPDIDTVQRAEALARESACNLVIGLGGGSALDTGKAVAAMLTNSGEVLDYLEVAGSGKTLRQPSAPFIAIPTTSGTGSEVTRNAVLAVPEQRVKVSIRSALMLPRVALVDPELTLSVPPQITATTGMDALTQVLEPFVSNRANPISDLTSRAGLERAAHWLAVAYRDGHNLAAREGMAFASLMGGLSLSNAGLGAVHGFAGAIGGMFDAPHGAICASLLPHVVSVNVSALQKRSPDSPVLERYTEIAQILTGSQHASIAEGIASLETLQADLRIANLSTLGVTAADIPALVEMAQKASSMKANPITLLPEELAEILTAAL